MKNKLFLFLLFFFVSITVFAKDNKHEFKAPEGFSITVPKSWTDIPIDVLQEHSKNLKEIPETKDSVYNYGFQRKFKSEWFEFPYILIMINEKERISPKELADIEKFRKETKEITKKIKKKFGSMAPEISIETAVYDQKHQCLWSEQILDYGFNINVKCLSGTLLTDKGSINVICYDLEPDYRRRKNLFRKIIQSVKLDENLVYNNKKKTHSKKDGGFINMIIRFIAALFKLIFN